MKEKLTIRNFIIWGAAFLGLLFFFLSFAATAKMSWTEGNHNVVYKFAHAIWSCNHADVYDNGAFAASGYIHGKPFILPILGVILILLSALGAVAVSFFIKDEKLSKILLIVAGSLSVLGGVFVFFVGESAIRSFAYEVQGSLDNMKEIKEEFKNSGGKFGPGGMSVIIGIVAILVGVAYAVVPFLPLNKQVVGSKEPKAKKEADNED